MRALVACLVLCIAAAQGDACPIVNSGRWPWVPYFVLSGARYDPETKGAVAIPPQPRLFVLRRFNDTTLPSFRTPQGDAIPLSVTECGQFVLVDLDIDSGTVIVEDSARSVELAGRTQTFVIRSGLPAATRRAELATDAYFPRLIPDSDAVAFRIDHADGTQTVQFNGPYIDLGWRDSRVVALYANRTEDVIFDELPQGHPLLALCLSLFGVVLLVGCTRVTWAWARRSRPSACPTRHGPADT